MGYTMKTIDELESIHCGAVKLAGAELGIRSFGLQVLDFPAGFSDYPEHDHAEEPRRGDDLRRADDQGRRRQQAQGDITCGSAMGGSDRSVIAALIRAPLRVESDTARMLVLSTPAGIEDMMRGLAEPAQWPWLKPPPDGPRVPPERIARVERQTGMVRHGPPPPRNEGP